RTYVFAIGTGGVMYQWTSSGGGPWTGPATLPGGNLEPSFPCALVLADGSVNVFAIQHGSGSLCRWHSADGALWNFQLDNPAAIPGVGTGVAAVARGGSRFDSFAPSPAGIVRYTFVGAAALPPGPMLPNSGGLNRCVLAASSAGGGTMDVFSADPFT